ncbi:MAG: alpha/beta hydrolase [Chitinispirillaceae bacterium]|nr:alpha/beta hydrolase [Chitinispirillaceae bacterium]
MQQSEKAFVPGVNDLMSIAVTFIFVLALHLQALSFSPDSLRRELPLLTDGVYPAHNGLSSYLKRYGLDIVGPPSIAGIFRSDSFTCFGQVYCPEHPHGTVFFLHGYFDHTGTVVNGIAACLQEQFTVAAFDLPGHGLSSGERGAINDFSEYVRAFREFMHCCEGLVDTPYVFIGHSAGCAVGYEYLSTASRQPFAKLIFLAPLVRSSFYRFSVVGNVIARPFLAATPRWFRNASHDREFLHRFRRDPLQPAIFPLRWADAYYRWFERIRTSPVRSLPLTVIQGTGDHVVDWRYNVSWLRKKIDGISIVTIPKARHQLLNESEPYRKKCADAIRRVLREAGEGH